MYYRYELWLDGEDMEVGFLQGLADSGLGDDELQRLAGLFDEVLPIPHDSRFPQGQRIVSWFTEEGRNLLAQAIEEVIRAYAEDGCYDVVERTVQSLSGIVYSDCFQVLTLGEYGGGDPNLEDAGWGLVS